MFSYNNYSIIIKITRDTDKNRHQQSCMLNINVALCHVEDKWYVKC